MGFQAVRKMNHVGLERQNEELLPQDFSSCSQARRVKHQLALGERRLKRMQHFLWPFDHLTPPGMLNRFVFFSYIPNINT